MKNGNNKRWMIIISGALIMILATAGFAISGFGGPFGPHGKGGGKDNMIAKVDYTLQELGLKPEQQAKYSKIRARLVQEMDAMRKQHDAIKAQVDSELAKPEPDVKVISKILKDEAQDMPKMFTAQIDSLMEVYKILDADQQKQLVQMLKEHHGPERRGPGGPEHP